MRAHYKHAAIIKVFLLHANTLRGMLRHLCEISTAFAKEDLSVKKIEQRTAMVPSELGDQNSKGSCRQK